MLTHLHDWEEWQTFPTVLSTLNQHPKVVTFTNSCSFRDL